MAQAESSTLALTQRETYKLVDKLLAGSFESEEDLLRTLVRDLCERQHFGLAGGRVWELDTQSNIYHLIFQHGSVARIPDDYVLSIDEQPVFTTLSETRLVAAKESDPLLLEKGITQYAATGVGDLVRRDSVKLFRYVLAFNASEFVQDIGSTITIIGSATITALRNMNLHKQQQQMKRDLDRASDLQRSLLPDHTLEFSDYRVFGISLPDDVVGGDYFDYVNPMDEDGEPRCGVVISDAASKGLPAAVQALFVSGALRMGIGFHTKISSLVSKLNALICDTFPFERFVTLCYCELTPSKNGLVLYSNAGHCSPLHYRMRDSEIDALMPTGGILGISTQQRFRVESINMMKGDILLLYTDGISEAQSSEEELFGEDRLRTYLSRHAGNSAREIAYGLLEEVQKFSLGASYTDDRTLVVIKRNP